MNKFLLAIPSLLVFSLGLGTDQSALALNDTCKTVRITIVNNTPDEIKVTKFQYFDADKKVFRTENLLGIDGQKKLEPNKSFTTVRNLGQIKDDETKFKVLYRHKIGGLDFGSLESEITPSFICQDGITKVVSLTK